MADYSGMSRPPDPKGIRFAKIAVGINLLSIPLAILIWSMPRLSELRPMAVGLVLFCGWIALVYGLMLKYLRGVPKWARWIVPRIIEKSYHERYLYGSKEETKNYNHAGRRFMVFCFVACFGIGFKGFEYALPSILAGLAAALIYDWIVTRKQWK